MANNVVALNSTEQTSILKAIYELVGEYPLLNGITVTFDGVPSDGVNLSILSTGGAKQLSSNILGGFKGMVPVILAWSGIPANDTRKINAVELLNNVGAWMGKNTITVDGTSYTLDSYPLLDDNRIIEKIEQTTVPCITDINDSGRIIYACTIQVTYNKED